MRKLKRVLRNRRRRIIQRSASEGIVQRMIDEYKSRLDQETISPSAPKFRRTIRKKRTIRKVLRKAKRQSGAKLSHELPEPASTVDSSSSKYKKIDFYYKSLELLGKVVSPHVYPEPLIFLYPTVESSVEERRQLNKFVTFCLNARGGKVAAQVLMAWPHGNHSNAILLDLDRKTMFWFEPEGYDAFEDLGMKTREEQIQYEHHRQISTMILDNLQMFYPSFAMAPLHISCPLVGPQGREEYISPGRGNCGIWSILFMHYCLLNPTLSVSDINTLMVYSFEPSEIIDRITTYKKFLIEYYETGIVNPDFQTFPVQYGIELSREGCQIFMNDLREKKPPRNPVTGKRQKQWVESDIRELRGICQSKFGL